MTKFENEHFVSFEFTKEQMSKNLKNALKDLRIAKEDKILEVKFNYAYTAFIKAGIALLSFYQKRAKSTRGHHIKIIEKIAQLLKDDTIVDVGNVMRTKRNLDLYAGGIEVTEKECKEYLNFVVKVIAKIAGIISV